jgi:hypothetical protein
MRRGLAPRLGPPGAERRARGEKGDYDFTAKVSRPATDAVAALLHAIRVIGGVCCPRSMPRRNQRLRS